MALRMTPALSLGVADHVWSIAELIDAALATTQDEPDGSNPAPTQSTHQPRLSVIQGGRA
jgi:hypothetical protein